MIKDGCKFLNDVECPYASGHENCDDCKTYEPFIHAISCKCHECEEERGCQEYHFKKDMGEI